MQNPNDHEDSVLWPPKFGLEMHVLLSIIISPYSKTAFNSWPQLEYIAFKLSTMFGKHFGIYLSQMPKIAFKLSTVIGENFEIYLSKMSKIAF